MKSSAILVVPRTPTIRRVVVALVAMLTVLLVAPPADAATWEYNRATLGSPGACDAAMAYPPTPTFFGSGCFRTSGDFIRVNDSMSDSYLVGVQWRVPGVGRAGLCVNASGGGTWTYCDKDFPETYWVDMRVGRCYNWRDCNLLSNWVNWGDWVGTSNMN